LIACNTMNLEPLSGVFQILLVTSSKHKDRWVVPGGGIEPCEQPDLAAVREAHEEAGAQGNLVREIGVFEVRHTMLHCA